MNKQEEYELERQFYRLQVPAKEFVRLSGTEKVIIAPGREHTPEKREEIAQISREEARKALFEAHLAAQTFLLSLGVL